MQTPPILVYSFCYAMVFILSLISKKERSQRLIKDDGTISDKPGNIIGLHIIGILWLGMVPAFILHQPVLKTLTGNSFPDILVLLILVFLIMLTATMVIKTGTTIQQQFADSRHHHSNYPLFLLSGILSSALFFFLFMSYGSGVIYFLIVLMPWAFQLQLP